MNFFQKEELFNTTIMRSATEKAKRQHCAMLMNFYAGTRYQLSALLYMSMRKRCASDKTVPSGTTAVS